MFATQSEAHREWHLNSGVPMGQPGCPQDACHPVYDEGPEPDVSCGNKRYHEEVGSFPWHYSAAEVRECYAHSGRFCNVQVVVGRQSGKTAAAEAAVAPAGPSPEQVAALAEAERKAKAAARYAAWATIPVGAGDYANYALRAEGETIRFYRVERPSEGKYAGKTYLKRYVSDDVVKTSWAEQGNALDAIAADPQAAAVLYGKETKRCAICHRKLTDDKNKGSDGLTSLERGIGPVCMTKMRG